jgi:ABC-type iron transport system FetAB ATPase subunit
MNGIHHTYRNAIVFNTIFFSFLVENNTQQRSRMLLICNEKRKDQIRIWANITRISGGEARQAKPIRGINTASGMSGSSNNSGITVQSTNSCMEGMILLWDCKN